MHCAHGQSVNSFANSYLHSAESLLYRRLTGL